MSKPLNEYVNLKMKVRWCKLVSSNSNKVVVIEVIVHGKSMYVTEWSNAAKGVDKEESET